MEKTQEQLYTLRHGALFIAERGLTTNEKYARKFTESQAIERKERFAEDNILIEIHKAEEE